MIKIKKSAKEQYLAEKKRFLARQKPKRVCADVVKSKEREVEEHDRRDYE